MFRDFPNRAYVLRVRPITHSDIKECKKVYIYIYIIVCGQRVSYTWPPTRENLAGYFFK